MTSGDPAARDRLAVDRTRLANERTLLAYERTALALCAAGVTLIHVFSATADETLGWFLVGVGAILAPFGVFRFVRVSSRLRS
jgi:putative membrane protein